MTEIPAREPDGEFLSFQRWVNHATTRIGGMNALCLDIQGRRCLIGADFMRARDEGAFPIRYWFGEGGQSEAEQRKNQRLADTVFRRAHGYWP